MSELDQPNVAWCLADETLIFLDVAGDRYFRLSDEANLDLLRSIRVSGRRPWKQTEALPRPESWVRPLKASRAIDNGRFRMAEVAQALWIQKRVEGRLQSGSLQQSLTDLRNLLENSRRPVRSEHIKVERCVRAFEQTRLLRTAADRCLTLSIALAIRLAAQGVRTHIVLGVRALPFSAHCWTQRETTVLNGSLEEVRRYEPILVV